MPNYTQEQLQKLYKKLPEELQEAIYSEETAEHIWNICDRNGIELISSLAEKVGNVLVGVLPPNKFQEAIEKELKLEKEKAKRVAWEVDRFIFRSVRPFLEKLYETEITQFTYPSVLTKEKIKTEKKPDKDKYREPIE